ncbi:MAG: NADH-quinone oxidoreductase subunit C [Candidatus Methylacidiphilales bacterium]|nr:NADH-quinone oxidoreductase subunit C [Candidatus Methylacidiphilales bacterium]
MATPTEAIQSLQSEFAGKVGTAREFRGEHTLEVDRDIIASVATHLRDKLGFDYLADICSVDNMGDEPRYEVVYEFASFSLPHHVRVIAKVSEDEQSLPTISGVYATANWHEREIWDMMGIKFDGHPDLRRILMWEGFPYFPLQRDFPLEGKPSDTPGEAFTRIAPLEGGPFVTAPADHNHDREPRARPPEPV